MTFVHLHTHSYYSLLQSPTSPKKIVATAEKQGANAVALTDFGVMYGAIEFYKACKDQGIKAILGMDVYIAPRGMKEKSEKQDGRPYTLVLLAENNTGYQNLLKLTTIAHLEGMYYKPRIDLEVLAQYKEGIIALSGGLQGELARSITSEASLEECLLVSQKYEAIFGKDHWYYSIAYRPQSIAQQFVNERLIEMSQQTGIPIVVAQDALYAQEDEAQAQDILSCLQTNKKLSDERFTLVDEDYSMADPQEIQEHFREFPEAIANTQRIADRCNVVLDLGSYHLPEFPLPKTYENNAREYFRSLCIEGLKKRYPAFLDHIQRIQWKDVSQNTVDGRVFSVEDKAMFMNTLNDNENGEGIAQRFEFEFCVIAEMGFENYFLIVWDIIKFAKDSGIIVGPGRGSAAGSIIAYALSITNIDPLPYSLLFERFLNPDRISMPDIDIDFQDNRRDEIIAYVTEKYGQKHVAQISTFGTMAAKAAIKDVGRVMGLSFQEMNEMAKLIPFTPGTKLDHAIETTRELKDLVYSSPKYTMVWEVARKLEGCVRHISVHACGFVISKEPLNHYSAVQHPPKDTTTIISQYSGKPLEDLGLLKMDFLGLRNLSIISKAIDIIRELHGVVIDIDTIPLDDEKAFHLLQQGLTTGVFQFESSGMRRYLKDLKPTVIEDIIAMGALYRPGPLKSGFVEKFINRKHGREAIFYPHPSMENQLQDTYGVVVYQEQIMNLSKTMAGFTGGEADTLRKAMGKKIKELMDSMKEKFIAGCQKNGIDTSIAEQTWSEWEEFAKYGFNKSHSVCYGYISYQTAYLKSHYPTEYMTALLLSDQDDTERIALEIEEVRNMGMEVVPPGINTSQYDFSVRETGCIQFGLRGIKNLGSNTALVIIEERQARGVFTSLEDFLSRVPASSLGRKNMEALIKSGAMDIFGDRSSLVLAIEMLLGYNKDAQERTSQGQMGLFDSGEKSVSGITLPNTTMTFSDRILWENEYLGLTLSQHPLAGLKPFFESNYRIISDISIDDIGVKKRFAGYVVAVQSIMTKSEETMLVITFQDISNTLEATIFPKIYTKYGNVSVGECIRMKGEVHIRAGKAQIKVDEYSTMSIDVLRKDAESRGLFNPLETQYPKIPLRNLAEEVLIASQKEPWEILLPSGVKEEDLVRLRQLLMTSPGDTPVRLLFSDGKTVDIPLSVEKTKVLESHVLRIL